MVVCLRCNTTVRTIDRWDGYLPLFVVFSDIDEAPSTHVLKQTQCKSRNAKHLGLVNGREPALWCKSQSKPANDGSQYNACIAP